MDATILIITNKFFYKYIHLYTARFINYACIHIQLVGKFKFMMQTPEVFCPIGWFSDMPYQDTELYIILSLLRKSKLPFHHYE